MDADPVQWFRIWTLSGKSFLKAKYVTERSAKCQIVRKLNVFPTPSVLLNLGPKSRIQGKSFLILTSEYVCVRELTTTYLVAKTKQRRSRDRSFRYHDVTNNYCKGDTESVHRTLK